MALSPEETLKHYWGFDQLMKAAKEEHDRLEEEIVNVQTALEEEIASLHTIMGDAGLMEMWLDGKHMKAHAFSVMLMKAQAYRGEGEEEE